jgi:hypothetical protein
MRRHRLARRFLGCAVLLSAVLSAPPPATAQPSDEASAMREIQALAWRRGVRRGNHGWCLRGEDNTLVVNYAIRLLRRRGVRHAVLVTDPARLTADVAEFKTALAGYTFVTGERYSEFRAGDRVAEYGLAALVLGGAAAVATKGGFLKAFGKLIAFPPNLVRKVTAHYPVEADGAQVLVATAGSDVADAFLTRLRRRAEDLLDAEGDDPRGQAALRAYVTGLRDAR